MFEIRSVSIRREENNENCVHCRLVSYPSKAATY
jgi:hypothetical protein